MWLKYLRAALVSVKIGIGSEIWNTAGEDPKNPHTGAAAAVKSVEPIGRKAAIWNQVIGHSDYQFKCHAIFKKSNICRQNFKQVHCSRKENYNDI